MVDARAAFVRLMSKEFDIPVNLSAAALGRTRQMGEYYSRLSDELIQHIVWRSTYNECVYQATKGRSE